MKKFSLLVLVAVLLLNFIPQESATSKISQEKKQELVQYLRSNWKTPEDYVISKFDNFDIVLIGEAHHIKHDVDLIHNLIPRLYKIGVYALGIEFGAYEYQDKVDALITAKTYDEDLARQILFKWASYWPYKEYLDIYKKAWELNRSLSYDEPKFRVVHLDYRPKWYLVKEGVSVQQKEVFFKGERDSHMFRVASKEFIKKNKKALIYAGQHHAFTHYFEPDYDHKNKKLTGFIKNRMGNLIYKKIPEKVFNICLHYPWPKKENIKKLDYPVDGIIDSLMREFDKKRIGFDVKNSPFGNLRDNDTFYSLGYKDFAFSTFCDGYIFQKHFSEYENCTADPSFITEENFKEALRYLNVPKLKEIIKTPELFLYFMKRNSNIERKFGHLQ